MTTDREAEPLGVGVHVHKNPPGYPNHSMVGQIISEIRGDFEVRWEDNTMTNENPETVEAH